MEAKNPFRLAVLVAALASGAAQANLLGDGDFESFESRVASGGYTVVTVDDPLGLGAWTVGGTSVDLIKEGYGSITNVSIDLAGSPGPGSLSQSFAAVLGQTYLLQWDYFKNEGTPLTFVFGGATEVLPIASAITHVSRVWQASFTGQSLVSFTSGGGYGGPTLDNISVTAVPEPQTYALMLAGLGVIGYVARRRRPHQG